MCDKINTIPKFQQEKNVAVYKPNHHFGSDFDDFLRQEGILDMIEEAAMKRLANGERYFVHLSDHTLWRLNSISEKIAILDMVGGGVDCSVEIKELFNGNRWSPCLAC